MSSAAASTGASSATARPSPRTAGELAILNVYADGSAGFRKGRARSRRLAPVVRGFEDLIAIGVARLLK